MRYITLLVLHVVCCRSVIVPPAVLLLAVAVNFPYVLQHLHRISALQGSTRPEPGMNELRLFLLLIFMSEMNF